MRTTTLIAVLLGVAAVVTASSQTPSNPADSPSSLATVSADFLARTSDATRKRDAVTLDRVMRQFATRDFVYISADGRRLTLDQVRASNQRGFASIGRVVEYRMENGSRSETGAIGVIRRTWILRVEAGQPPRIFGQRITLEERWVRQQADWKLASIREVRRSPLDAAANPR